ncbi:MAG: DUF4091 domain-containing protein [Clostridia bacterium]|nr:DUF4091 domain-containing protein [Clostridia bacterium]
MKRIVYLFLFLLILCLTLTACGGRDTPAESDTEPVSEAFPTEAPATDAPAETPTEPATEEPTEAPTEAPVEENTDPLSYTKNPVLEAKVDELLAAADPAGEPDNAKLTAEHEDAGLDLWFNHAYTKTVAEDTQSTGVNTYRMRLAKNEIEACHLLLASAEGRTGLTVSVSDFVNGDGAVLVTELMYAYYFDDVDGKSVPDPAPWVREGKTFDLTAGRSQLFIIKVHAAADSPAGLYEAVVTVKNADGQEIRKAAVSAYVWDFALPEETSCKTQMDLSWWNIYSAHHCYEGDDSVLYCNYYDYLLENRICSYTLPYDTEGYYTDERILRYLDNPRVVAFNPIGWKKDATPDRVSAAYRFLSQKQEWLDKAYFYVVDEPSGQSDLDRINAAGKVLKENFPGYKMMSPMHMNKALNAKQTDDFFSYISESINVWCIKPFFFTTYEQYTYSKKHLDKPLTYLNTLRLEKAFGTFEDRMAAEVEGGDELWWYVVHEPEYPEITLVMDEQAVKYRILFWQQKLYGVQSFLYYSCNDWAYLGEKAGLDPKHEVSAFPFDVYGNGILVWCGKPFDEYGPVGSLRLECVRDGIEDFEYLTMLEKLYGKDVTDALICRLTCSLAVYNTDEAFFTSLRTALGNVLAAAQGQ